MPVNVGGDDGEVEGQIQGILLAVREARLGASSRDSDASNSYEKAAII